MCILELQTDTATNGTTFNMETIKNKLVEKVKELENTNDMEFPTEESETRLEGTYKGYEFYIDEKYVAHIGDKATGIRFYYEIDEKLNGSRKITMNIQNAQNGIDSIKIQNDTPLKFNGSKKQEKIQYTVEVGKEYKVEIKSMNGDEKEKSILIEPEIQINDPYIGEKNTETDASKSVSDNSQIKGNPLYINFEATLEGLGTTCSVYLKNEPEKVLPYKIEENGNFTFVVSGKYSKKTVEKEIQIEVKKYTAQGCFVKYDAGEWSKEEIEELQENKLYDVNINKDSNSKYKLREDNGLNWTFGGFTYKEDTINEEAVKNKKIITNKNKSVDPQTGYFGTSKNEGWQILECNQMNGKTYVTKIIHAGNPENFVFKTGGTGTITGYCSEYLLSSGVRCKEYKKYGNMNINFRNWDMYKDNELYNKGYIKEIHAMTYDEALGITGNKNETNTIRKTGGAYYLASSCGQGLLYSVSKEGIIVGEPNNGGNTGCLGIRPVVELKNGVYISSGSGTESDPYVLEKEQ